MPRERFPLNVQSEVSVSNSGISIQTKKSMMILVLVFLTGIITWLFYILLKDTPFRIVSLLIGFVIGLVISIFIYNNILTNKDREAFEDSKSNKIFKFFKLSIGTGFDNKTIKDVECTKFMSGQYVISLSMSVGNTNLIKEKITEKFLDSILTIAHNEKYKIKIYTVPNNWVQSDLRRMYLQRLAKVHDKKLRNTLSMIDSYQTDHIFNKSSVPTIVIAFVVNKAKLDTLSIIIDFVSNWVGKNKRLSSLREIKWLTRSELVEVDCQYLGTKMVDVSPLANKDENVVLDLRKMIRVHNSEAEFSNYSNNKFVSIDTNSVYIRHSKFLEGNKNRRRTK